MMSKHFYIQLEDRTGSDLALGKEDQRLSFRTVPKFIDGQFVHIDALKTVHGVDVDSDGTPNSDLEGERAYDQMMKNIRWSILGGRLPIFRGGDGYDLSLLRFVQMVRDGLLTATPSDAGASSAADIFSEDVKLLYTFGRERPGRRTVDGAICRCFIDPDVDDIIYNIPAATDGPLGDVSGLTVNTPTKYRTYARCFLSPVPLVAPEHVLTYDQHEVRTRTILPYYRNRAARRALYIGLRQRPTDAEGYDWSGSGNWTVTDPETGHQLYVNQPADEVGERWEDFGASLFGWNGNNANVPGDAAVPGGHMPFVWDGVMSDLANWGASPVQWETTSLGNTRTSSNGSPRELRSELYALGENAEGEIADRLGLSLAQLRRTYQGDSPLLTRRVPGVSRRQVEQALKGRAS